MRRLILAFFSSLLVLASGSAPAQKTPDIRLDTDAPGAAYSFAPRMVASGDHVYVAWVDTRNNVSLGNALFANVSEDRGSTWLANDVRVSTNPVGSRALEIDLAADDQNVFAVWSETPATPNVVELYCNRSLDGGVTWLPTAVRIDSGTANARSPRIAVDGMTVYVVWNDNRSNPGPFTSEVFFNRSLDGGLTWLPQDIKISTAVVVAQPPQIAAAGSSVYVAWCDRRNALVTYGDDVFFNRSLDGGLTWLPADERLDRDSPGTAESWRAQIAASGSSVFVTWEDHRNGSFDPLGGQPGDIYFNRSLDGGATWLVDDKRINTDVAGQQESAYPLIGVRGSKVFVAWGDARFSPGLAGDIFVNRSLDGGATWLAQDVRVNSTPPGAARSWLGGMAVSDSAVALAWGDTRNSPVFITDIYFNRSLDDGLTWLGSDVRLDVGTAPGAVYAFAPAIAAAQDSVYVAWNDTRSSGGAASDVFFNIPFGTQSYGAGKAGSGGLVPVLTGSGPANPGETVDLAVTDALGGSTAALLAGLTRAATPLLGGTLLVGPPLLAPPVVLGGANGVPGAGTLSLPLGIPADPALVGGALFFQVLPLDSGATGGVAMSNGVELWIG